MVTHFLKKGEINMKDSIVLLLAVIAALTGLVTEAIKRTFNLDSDKVPLNLLTAVVSVVCGAAVGAGYFIMNSVPITPQNIVYLVIIIVASWISSMLGFDKIKETFTQLINNF